MGPDAISFADTIGVGVPKQVRILVEGMADTDIPVGCHFHDTRNTGVANALAAVESGAQMLDASRWRCGQLPLAPAATGNVATEDVVYMLHGMGYETGIDLDKLISTAKWLEKQLEHSVPSALHRAGPFKCIATINGRTVDNRAQTITRKGPERSAPQEREVEGRAAIIRVEQRS